MIVAMAKTVRNMRVGASLIAGEPRSGTRSWSHLASAASGASGGERGLHRGVQPADLDQQQAVVGQTVGRLGEEPADDASPSLPPSSARRALSGTRATGSSSGRRARRAVADNDFVAGRWHAGKDIAAVQEHAAGQSVFAHIDFRHRERLRCEIDRVDPGIGKLVRHRMARHPEPVQTSAARATAVDFFNQRSSWGMTSIK